ncbi:MAG: glycosyltransferase [Phycisphaerales bacterium]
MAELPLRILHFVCGAYERGGMQKHVLDLVSAQVDAGDSAALLAHPSFGAHLDARVKLIPLDTSRSRRNKAFARDVARAIEHAKPDVIHAHAGKASSIVAALMPLRCASVSTVHGLKRDLRAPARFDRVIAVSEFAAKKLPRDRTTVIFNGSAPRERSLADPSSLAGFFEKESDMPIAIAIGRLAPVKGFDTLVRAWASVRRARLVIVGDGPERSRLARRIEKHALRDRVVLAGEIPDAGALLPAAAVMVAPSLREGFPYVVVEALQARTPIITTTTSGAAPVLPAKWLVPPRRPSLLAERVNRLLHDPDAARADFAPAFERSRTEFTLEGMASRTRDVYAEAIAVHAARRSV